MASISEEVDPRAKSNEDHQTRRIKDILVELLILPSSRFVKQIEKELEQYNEELLRTVGRNYYLNPPLVCGRLYVKERFQASALLEKVENNKSHAHLKNYNNIRILLESIQAGREEFQTTNLPEDIFNNNAELPALHEHLYYFLSGPNHNSNVIPVFDKLVKHAQRHLHNAHNSKRAQRGNQKYQQLVQLFQEIRKIDGFEAIPRLKQTAALIKAELDADPEDDNLIANRGGFFGAYKTYSQCLNKFGFLHYEYNGRTAISTTDHLLIELLDAVQDELKYLGADETEEPRVVILD